MVLSQQLITEDLYTKAISMLQAIAKENRVAIRLKAIVSAKKHGVAITAKIFDISTNTLRTWVKSLRDNTNLEYKSGRGRKSKLQSMHINYLKKLLEKDCNLSLNYLVLKLKEQFNISVGKSTVHRALEKFRYGYITPRPLHHKQDKTKHMEFKKKSTSYQEK